LRAGRRGRSHEAGPIVGLVAKKDTMPGLVTALTERMEAAK
jgi:hypothetical protein